MAVSLVELRSRTVEAALLSAAEIGTFESSLPHPPIDGEALARELVRAKKLTAYQAQALLQNKAKSLVLGEYVVLDKLGQGGMGMVLQAEHRRMKRIVALKVLSPNLTRTTQAVARFHREVQAVARLNHPHVVAAFDAGEAKGIHYLVMEYVDGKDLSSLVKSVGPMSVDDAIRCVREAAIGLQYAHERGIVHRDIKPGNLLLDKTGNVKILDMGLARIDDPSSTGEELTGSGQIMGTAEYMSPEQALDTRHADARADIYSLGCTLFYLLTGRNVYGGDTALKKILAHRDQPIPSLIDAIASTPASGGRSSPVTPSSSVTSSPSPTLRALDALFRRMVAKDPAERPQTMTDVLAELDRCVAQPETMFGGESPSSDSHLHAFLRHMGEEQSVASLSPRTLPPSRGPQSRNETNPESFDSPQPLRETQPSTQPATKPPVQVEQLPLAPDPSPPQTGERGDAVRGANGAKSKGNRRANAALPSWLRKRSAQIGLGGAVLSLLVALGMWIAFAGRGIGRPDNGEIAKFNVPDGGTATVTDPDDGSADAPMNPPRFKNSLGMEFALVPKGKAWLGGGGGKPGTIEVEFADDFYLGVHEVTQEEWQKVTGTSPGWYTRTGGGGAAVARIDDAELRRFPVESVSWEDCRAFVEKLNSLTPESEWLYRLPTAQEWEYACRGGPMRDARDGAFNYYLAAPSNAPPGADQANVGSLKRPCRVGSYPPNRLGLHDMHGNAGEWCLDELPPGADGVRQRVWRGGNYSLGGWRRTAADRNVGAPSGLGAVGLRVARVRRSSAAATPPVAVAPFDAAQAHQAAWAAHLGEPVETTNSIGMKFVVIPPGTFTMGSPPGETGRQADEDPVEVTLTRPFRLGMHEVTQGQWKGVMENEPWMGKPDVIEGAACFASYVSWEDATAFCRKLTEQERKTGRLSTNDEYRLPTEAEWEYACRAGTMTAFSFGDDESQLGDFAWYKANAIDRAKYKYARTVGLKKPNPWGMHDVHGSVWEWCGDWLGEKLPGGTDPLGPSQGSKRTCRGGSWFGPGGSCRSAYRNGYAVRTRTGTNGFRVVCTMAKSMNAAAPPPAVAPFDAATAKAHQAVWATHLGEPVETTNSIGMTFVVIPPGKFTMGEGGGATAVTLTRPFRIGIHEVTQGQWQATMGTEPWKGKPGAKAGADYPATFVNWDEAREFCRKRTVQERTAGRLATDEEHRLPTEAEWEWACRTGTTGSFAFVGGDADAGEYAWSQENATKAGAAYAHAVGQKKANAWGLFDVHGNVQEWCADWSESRLRGGIDPQGPTQGTVRADRGGSWNSQLQYCRSPHRGGNAPDVRANSLGFRVVRTIAWPRVAATAGAIDPTFFNGKDLTGWIGDPTVWRVEDGAIVAEPPKGRKVAAAFLRSAKSYRDFEVSFRVEMTVPDQDGGFQFHSRPDPADPLGMIGPQFGLGGRHWGSVFLTTTGAKGTFLRHPQHALVLKTARPTGTNDVVARCVGRRATLVLNGATVGDGEVDVPAEGHFAWQWGDLHGATKLVFRDISFVDRSAPPATDPESDRAAAEALRSNCQLDLRLASGKSVYGLWPTDPLPAEPFRVTAVRVQPKGTPIGDVAFREARGEAAFLDALAALPQAVLLNDHFNRVGWDGLKVAYIADRTSGRSLTTLELPKNSLSPATIAALARFPRLTTLAMKGSKDSPDAKALAAALPKCRIVLADGTIEPTAAPWRSLFNGKDLTGWKHASGSVAEDWAVEGTNLVNLARTGAKRDSHLETTDSFHEFTFRCEFRLTPGAYGKLILGGAFVDLNDVAHGFDGGESGTIRNLGGVNWLKATGSVYKGPNEWNALEVRRLGKSFRVTLNGVVVNDKTDVADPVPKPIAITQFTQQARLQNLQIEESGKVTP